MYLLGNLPFFKITWLSQTIDMSQLFYGPSWLALCQCYLKMHVVGDGPGASLWVLRHFLSLISSLSLLMGISLLAEKLARGHTFCPLLMCQKPSLFYILIKLYYTKSLSNQASSLALDCCPLFQRPRIPASFMAQQQPFSLMWKTFFSKLGNGPKILFPQ